MSGVSVGVSRLARIVLNSADPEKLSGFFIGALGFEVASGVRQGQAEVLLALGDTLLELRPAGPDSRPYPPGVHGWSPLFQHCALITDDIARSLARLTGFGSFTPISTHGPQQLPAASGGVTAFKFRDPEGHPLEFIAPKPTDQPVIVRIDHSAISVRETARSVAFYENIGLKVGRHSLNFGIAQQRLDNVPNAVVEVSSLELPAGTAPHVELLCYRGDYDRAIPLPGPEDIAATRLVFAVRDGATMEMTRDPDGHILQFDVGASA
jgi:catechol 2,3-dioxygenase-like lactoylglutathione lyase family enzyme